MSDYEQEELNDTGDEGMSLAEQVEVLFQYGESKKMVTSYHGISAAIGIAPINIQKLRQGVTKNPGINILRSVAQYFGVGLGYFDCSNAEECWEHLRSSEQRKVLADILQDMPLRADELTPETFRAMLFAMEQVRKAEARAKHERDDK